jgi:hypothetical protein
VLDLIAEVKCIPLHLEAHHDIRVGMRRHMEVAWDTVDLEGPYELASLLLIELLFDVLEELFSGVGLLERVFHRDRFAVLVKSFLKEVASDVDGVGAHHILDVEAEDFARHFFKDNVHIDREPVIVMRDIYQHL